MSRKIIHISAEYFSKGGKSLTFGQAGPVWKIQRKITHDTFRYGFNLLYFNEYKLAALGTDTGFQKKGGGGR